MSTKITLKNVILSYPNLFNAKQIMNQGEPKFSTAILISKDDKENIKKLKAAIEEAKKDDRFFFASADKGKIASRESKKRKANAQSDFTFDEFAGIKFGRAKADGAPKLEKPYRLLTSVSKTSYAGNKLTGFTLAADSGAVKAMTEEDLQMETCKLVRALEGELGVQFAVTSSKIDFTGKKTSVVVHSSKASGVLSVQFSRK